MHPTEPLSPADLTSDVNLATGSSELSAEDIIDAGSADMLTVDLNELFITKYLLAAS